MADQTQDETKLRNAGLSLNDTDNIDEMYLTFALANEEYGVGIAGVTEIVGMQRIMSVPDVPHYIKGVINLRGKVIPLMDVRLRFGMPERAYDERTVVIVMDVADAPIGLIVDGVSEVLEIPPAQVDRHTQFGRSASRPVISGIGRIGDRVAVLLDTSVLVSDTDIAVAHDLSVAAE
jgi:purine-binding chemotaxis protein CheW